MLEIAPGWLADVERGPDWLFVKLKQSPSLSADVGQLAEKLWSMLGEHFIYRLVLELDGVPLDSQLVDQLALLQQRIQQQGGLLRLCGLSQQDLKLLRARQLDARLPSYCCREDAVYAHHPVRPR